MYRIPLVYLQVGCLTYTFVYSRFEFSWGQHTLRMFCYSSSESQEEHVDTDSNTWV